jgi:LPPG:FO 2-phospho-L-lactate transferase
MLTPSIAARASRLAGLAERASVRRVTVLAGGYGGAKLSHGLALASAAARERGEAGIELSIVVNTGDDLEVHGLAVSPDLDTVMYTLAGLANDVTGWGVRDETWSGSAMLARYGAETWFGLGDRDIATNLLRSQALRAGERLTEVTARLAGALGVPARLLPMADEPVRTEVLTADGWLEFQEYFVHRHHAVDVHAVRHRGAEAARPTPEVLAAMAEAELIVFAPSNPFVSIGTILAVPGMLGALLAPGAPVVAVSPIVGGAALRGPADRMFETLGGDGAGVGGDGAGGGREASASGVVTHYRTRFPGLVDAFVIDELDADAAAGLRAAGATIQVAQTVMRDDAGRQALAEAVLARWLPGWPA